MASAEQPNPGQSAPTPAWTEVARLGDLPDRGLKHAVVAGVDLVVIRLGDGASVLYGRCLHRGALLSDGHVDGDNLICGLHGWDYRVDTGISEYNNDEALQRFESRVDRESDAVVVDEHEVRRFALEHPQPYDRKRYLGLYADVHGASEEPFAKHIQKLAVSGLSGVGSHGVMSAMGVPRQQLPSWDDLQILTAQLARQPLLDGSPVDARLVVGPSAKKPLELDIPIFVSDMSFGALSAEAKTALARGAELAGTGICSGEGGMLPAEKAECRRYFYELASAKFGWDLAKVADVQAFHFKAGQAAKTGTGGHLPADKSEG